MKKNTAHSNDVDKSSSSSFFNKKKNGEDASFAKKDQQPFFNTTAVQPKLKFGQPNDPFEKEADAIADKVIADQHTKEGTSTSPPKIQMKQEDQEMLRSKPIFESPSSMDLHSARAEEMIQGKDATSSPPSSSMTA